MIFIPYLQAFFRLTIGLVFTLSFLGKMRDPYSFILAIERFRVIPHNLSRITAYIFLTGELMVIITMLLGGPFLFWGFLLAAVMLVIFCFALASTIVRKIQTSCNCFGISEKPVSIYDIVRNVGFILSASAGCGISTLAISKAPELSWLEWVMVSVMAGVFLLVWVQVGEIAALLLFARRL